MIHLSLLSKLLYKKRELKNVEVCCVAQLLKKQEHGSWTQVYTNKDLSQGPRRKIHSYMS